MAQQFQLPVHQHGKSKVRLGRTWRVGDFAYFVEWNVNTMLEASDAQGTTWFQEVGGQRAEMVKVLYPISAPCSTSMIFQGNNTGMTATDTQKNTVSAAVQNLERERAKD